MKKKKGSSLITVIIFMMFLMIVGTTTITTTMMDYKLRVNESNRVENLYGAESGLEIAYDILLKSSDYAVSQALNHTNQQLQYEQNNPTVDRVNLDDLFKLSYVKALLDESYSHSTDHQEVKNHKLLEYAVENFMYPFINETNKLDFKETGFNPLDKDLEIELEVLTADDEPVMNHTEIKERFKVKIVSTYKSTDVKANMSESERAVSRIFEFELPTYSQVIVDYYPVFKDKVLSVDGNMTVKGSASSGSVTNLKVDGDVWVGGDLCVKSNPICAIDGKPAITDLSYKKYENGLLMEDASLEIEGNIMTRETVSLYNNATLRVSGNVYGRNIYAGKKDIGSISQNLELVVSGDETNQGEVVLSNDLAVNIDSQDSSQKTSIKMDRFYGVSDKNIKKDDILLDNVSSLAQESSSILVNNEGASIEIKEEAYIGGVAFIDVTDEEGNKYQTAESVAVKPNYLAYSMILPGYEDKVSLRYYNPLLLVETIYEDGMTLHQAKENYFVNVGKSGLLSMSSGGVKLPLNKTYSAGSVVSESEGGVSINGALGMVETGESLKQLKTSEHEKYVKYMGSSNNTNTNQRTVETQINWNSGAFADTVIESSSGSVILNNNSHLKTTIRVENGQYIAQVGEQTYQIQNHIFLVTKGDVEIQGDIELVGCLLVGGYLEFDNKIKNASLIYDDEFIQNILLKNSTQFKNLFVDWGKETISVGENDEQRYDATTIVSKGRWELRK